MNGPDSKKALKRFRAAAVEPITGISRWNTPMVSAAHAALNRLIRHAMEPKGTAMIQSRPRKT